MFFKVIYHKMQAFLKSLRSESVGRKIFLLVWLMLIVCSLVHSVYNDFYYLNYCEWGISEWLINYQGGFVRRGLFGQGLFLLYQLHPFNLRFALLTISVLTSFLFLILIVRIFIRRGWSMAILPLGCCFFFTFLSIAQRKDFILLLLTYAVFTIYKHYLTRKSVCSFILLAFLSVLLILIHEAAFFFCFPIMALYTWAYGRRASVSLSWHVRQWLAFVPAVCALAFITIFKGNGNAAQAIWMSWGDAFRAFPDGANSLSSQLCYMGYSVEALSWSLHRAMEIHLSLNFFGYYPIRQPYLIIVCVPLWIGMFACYYYLVTRLNTVDIFAYRKSANVADEVSNTLLAQFVFMLPLFTVLSCDFGRTLPYWVFSSLMAVDCFGKLSIKRLEWVSLWCQKPLRRRFFNHPLTYTLAVLIAPLIFASSPINSYQMRLLTTFIRHII